VLFVQTFPQAPQLLLSNWRSTHGSLVEQHVWPGAHDVPLQTPAWQESAVVHASLSSHAVPSGTSRETHWPLLGLQSEMPVAHGGGNGFGGQMTGEPTQLPPWHVSPTVHALPSLHGVPSIFDGYAH